VKVEVDGVEVTIGPVTILNGVSVEVRSGEVHGLVGPNGSGKSTFLRCLYRSLRPTAGRVLLGDDDLWRTLSAREAARRRAIVAQDAGLDLDFRVRDAVLMGRAPHKGLFARDDRTDEAIVADALAAVSMAGVADRPVSTLSGGERQRVFLARALAQQAPVLLLDEPTNHLDVRSQLELLDLVRALGLTTVAALHDLDHAASYCDRVTLLRTGTVVASGDPVSVFTEGRIGDVFGVRAHVGTHPLTGRIHLTFASVISEEDPPC
jgi:iron complex transport system ATP-binding protein